MRCSLCGSENSDTSSKCAACDQPFTGETSSTEHVFLEPTDLSHPSLIGRRVAYAVGILLLIALPWFLMSDLFQTPPEVIHTQELFQAAHQRYRADKNKWDEKKDQVLLAMGRQKNDPDLGKSQADFRDLPFEVMISYLEDDLRLFREDLPALSVYPLPSSQPIRLVLAKTEHSIGFLPIVTSMEVELAIVNGRFSPAVVRLRRGEREVPPALCWTYFGPELQLLRRLEAFRGGVYSLEMAERENDEKIYLSYSYHHRVPFKAY